MAGLTGRRFNPEEHVRWTELLGLDGHHSQGSGSSTGQYPRCRIGLVAESGDGIFDSEACLVGDTGKSVQHPGDRHHGDASLGGDVGHDGAACGYLGRHAEALSTASA